MAFTTVLERRAAVGAHLGGILPDAAGAVSAAMAAAALGQFAYDYSGAAPPAPPVPGALTASIAAGPEVDLDCDVSGISDATHFSIQRRDKTAAGSFAELTTVTSFPYAGDTGPFTANHAYEYKVVVVGGASDGDETNAVTVFQVATGGVRRRMIPRRRFKR